MNPHKKYALIVVIGSLLAAFSYWLVNAHPFIGAGAFYTYWRFPILEIVLIRWAVISFRRLSAKKAANANRPTPAKESGD
jgi:hypothetical protein